MSQNEQKVKKPIYKKWWFWVIAVIVLFGIIGANNKEKVQPTSAASEANGTSSPKSESTTKPTVTPSPTVTVTATPKVEPTKAPEKKLTEIKHWKGNGAKNTETFVTTDKEWVIKWETKNENIAGILGVMVYDENGNMVDLPVNSQGVGKDETYVRTKPGKYYLSINSANVDWDISVQENR